MRGKTANPHRFDRKPIREHIESFKPCISHYRRAHAPNRRYLSSELNVADKQKDFIDEGNGSCSYSTYLQEFQPINISLRKLGHEECEQQREQMTQHNM